MQLETGKAIKKLIVLALQAALRCISLKKAYDDRDENVPAERLFNTEEVNLLHLEMKMLHAKSPKSKDGINLFREGSLPWAAWIIARLGGWNSYESSFGKPGYIKIKTGLDHFYQHLEIYRGMTQLEV